MNANSRKFKCRYCINPDCVIEARFRNNELGHLEVEATNQLGGRRITFSYDLRVIAASHAFTEDYIEKSISRALCLRSAEGPKIHTCKCGIGFFNVINIGRQQLIVTDGFSFGTPRIMTYDDFMVAQSSAPNTTGGAYPPRIVLVENAYQVVCEKCGRMTDGVLFTSDNARLT